MSMKQTLVVSLAGGLICAVGIAGFVAGHGIAPGGAMVVAQPEGQPSPEEMEAMMEEGSKLAPQHAWLRPLVGEWDAEMSFQMAPGADPEVSHGSSKKTLILGGRFLKEEFKGDVQMFGEKVAFEGFGLTGFDKDAGEFVSTWCDTMSTSLLVSHGKAGESPEEITVTGMMPTPVGDMPMKMVYKIESDTKHSMEMWQGMPGSDEMMKVGTITYTKKG